jgi:hypothetical protein
MQSEHLQAHSENTFVQRNCGELLKVKLRGSVLDSPPMRGQECPRHTSPAGPSNTIQQVDIGRAGQLASGAII